MTTINIAIIFALQRPPKRSIFRIMIQVSALHTAKLESKCLLASFTPMETLLQINLVACLPQSITIFIMPHKKHSCPKLLQSILKFKAQYKKDIIR